MKKKIHPQNNEEIYYDINDDFYTISVDFRRQYDRSLQDVLNDDDVIWPEFLRMLSGLDERSQLVNLIRIRSEKDPTKIKKFNSWERKQYLDWRKKHPQKVRIQSKDEAIKKTDMFFEALKRAQKQQGG